MDIFTHLLSGYLISYWISGYPFNLYVILGTFMAVAPDLDLFLKPLCRRLPQACHHGITHTFLFIIIISTVIYIILGVILGFSNLGLLLLMYLTGSLHLLWDFVGTGGVRPFYPIGRKFSKLNLEVGANPVLGIYSLLSAAFLLGLYFHPVEFIDFRRASFLAGAGYVLDLCLRAAMKHYYSRKPENEGFTALPTIDPRRWRFAKRIDTEKTIEVIIKTGQRTDRYSIPKAGIERIERCRDLASTYWLPQVQEHLRIFDFPYYRVDCGGGKREIIWNTAEMGRVVDIKVAFVKDKLKVSTEYRRSLKNYWDDLE